MATRKAVERAKLWRISRRSYAVCKEGLLVRHEEFDEALAAYEAATIEQCAQIAEGYARQQRDDDDFESGIDWAVTTVAAAIRSIAQQDSANEGQ